jgi:hypothetical protein
MLMNSVTIVTELPRSAGRTGRSGIGASRSLRSVAAKVA